MTIDESYLAVPEVILSPRGPYADDLRKFQGIPGIERASNGRLWATWYGGGEGEGKENYIMLATSADDGLSWSDLKLVIDPPFRASEPGLWHDPQGRLWLMWNQYPTGLLESNSAMWAIVASDSGCENPAWSPPRLIARELNCFNKPIVLSDGTWFWPAGSWYELNPSRPLLSHDNGRTFLRGGVITVPEGRNYDEYNVVELRDGRLWLLNRTHLGMVESFSTDKGLTWTEARPSNIEHATSRHFLTRLRSGNLLLVKHGAIDQRIDRSHLMAFLSGDEGNTWSDGLLLDERKSVSYPDGVQAEDGTIYVIYDFERTGAKEILMARFTENEVARGKPTLDAVQRLLVNKASGENPNESQ
ncbi:MAG: exo-alpha-sialidase [Candidatus Latescibacteria bacterium]|nr:exo-alpha-sialidase [Candidatus Latescibacterota bacterium]